MAMLRCALWVRHADRCVDVARAISCKDYLRNLPAVSVVFWSLIRGAHRRLVKAEKALSDPAWRNIDGWAGEHKGIQEKRRLLEKWLQGGGGRRRKLPRRWPSWLNARLSPGFS